MMPIRFCASDRAGTIGGLTDSSSIVAGGKIGMRHLICATFCSLLCSCIALPESYFLPVSDVGQLQRAACGTYGPNDSITIKEDGVSIHFRLGKMSFKNADVNVDLPSNYQARNRYLVLRVVIEVEPGNFAIMHNQELNFSVNSSVSKAYKFNSFFNHRGKYFQSETFAGWDGNYTGMKFGERLDFISSESGHDNMWESRRSFFYRGDVWLDVNDADSVRVDPIEIEVNGRKVEIGYIDFIKKSGVYVYPLNC